MTSTRRPRGRPRTTHRLAPVLLAGATLLVAGFAFAAFTSQRGDTSAAAPEGGAGSVRVAAGVDAPDVPTVQVPAAAIADGRVGTEDGLLMKPASPFDLSLPAVARLDAYLLLAVQAAARDAAGDGVPLLLTSGWRSPDYQQQLLDEAVEEYGSLDEALRYVATAGSSSHVTGQAVDVGPTDADSWLSQHGVDYGLCQTYANEMWHFERSTVPGGECPPMRHDASE